jgi:hypothetical protein
MKKYGIVPHSELESSHYKAILQNQAYQMEGMMDVLREEMMMNMPCYPPPDCRRTLEPVAGPSPDNTR